MIFDPVLQTHPKQLLLFSTCHTLQKQCPSGLTGVSRAYTVGLYHSGMSKCCNHCLAQSFQADYHRTHCMYTRHITVIYCCHQLTTGIGIGTQYLLQNRPKVLVFEVSVNCGIGLTLVYNGGTVMHIEAAL